MKWAILLLCVVLASSARIDQEKDCKCWENFKPEKSESGFYCRGEKVGRIFGCNEEAPPICKCLVNGKLIELDLGETTCLSVDLKNGRWCQNREEWNEYFKKHPEHNTYD